eukprot:Gb_05070 [translate_table: standard]
MKRTDMGAQNPSEMDYSCADSVDSSPRSVGTGRGTDSEYCASQRWDDTACYRVRLMCSFGGKILPRPHDNQLCYVGGETRIVVVHRNITYADLIAKLSKIYGSSVCLKYQLPNEDLDALISVTTDEDLENMMEEYDRFQQTCSKPPRLRIFLFSAKPESTSSLGSLLESSKREHWFVDALNGTPILSRGLSEGSSVVSETPDYLFGLDNFDYWDRSDERNANMKLLASGMQQGPPIGKSRMFNVQQEGNMGHPPPDVHSAPDSPMLETSSYGSTSSAPPGSNLPPLKVKPVQDEASDVQQQRGNIDSASFRRYDTGSQSPSIESQEQRLAYEDMGRTVGYRGNNQVIVNCPDDHRFDVHNGGDNMFRTPQDIGLRTQDPRLNLDDHIPKSKYQKQEQYMDQVPSKDGKIPVSNPSETVINKPRQIMPEITQRQPPIQEFEQLQIFTKQEQQQQQQQREKQIRQEYNMQEEIMERKHDWNVKPANSKAADMNIEGISHSGMKKEGSQSNLAALTGMKRDGSQSSTESDQRNANRQKQDEINPVSITTGQMKPLDRSKYQDPVILNSANTAQRDRPNPNLDRRAEDMDSGPEINYMQKDQNVMVQQTQQDHNYMQFQYEQQYVPPHFLHQGQPVSYYQVHHDPQLQQGDQPYPIYLVPAHHASPMLQTMSTVIRPTPGQAGYNVPLQRNMGVTPVNAPAVYSADVLLSKPVTTTVQAPAAPSIQRQTGHDPIPKVVNVTGAPYRDQQVTTQPNTTSAPPRYRAPRPAQSDVRMMYRPPQQVNPTPVMLPDQQYGYQHVQVAHGLAYETNPPQVYYTQNASIVNPQYQGLGPVNPDVHSSPEILPEAKLTRVSQSF